MGILLAAAVIGILPAYIAQSKGRSFILWWIYGMALFIIALPHSLLAKSNKRNVELRQLSQGMRKCNFCAEMIKTEALVCRFCGNGLSTNNHNHQPLVPNESSQHPSSLKISEFQKSGITLNEYYKQLNKKK